MPRIYTTRCKINMPHDFPDYPCPKCNGIILTKKELIIKGVGLLLIIIGTIVMLW